MSTIFLTWDRVNSVCKLKLNYILVYISSWELSNYGAHHMGGLLSYNRDTTIVSLIDINFISNVLFAIEIKWIVSRLNVIYTPIFIDYYINLILRGNNIVIVIFQYSTVKCCKCTKSYHVSFVRHVHTIHLERVYLSAKRNGGNVLKRQEGNTRN